MIFYSFRHPQTVTKQTFCFPLTAIPLLHFSNLRPSALSFALNEIHAQIPAIKFTQNTNVNEHWWKDCDKLEGKLNLGTNLYPSLRFPERGTKQRCGKKCLILCSPVCKFPTSTCPHLSDENLKIMLVLTWVEGREVEIMQSVFLRAAQQPVPNSTCPKLWQRQESNDDNLTGLRNVNKLPSRNKIKTRTHCGAAEM